MGAVMFRTTRRTFVSGAAWAGAAWAAPSERIRAGLIGCGGIGKVDLRTFLGNAEVDCPVICEVDEARFDGASKIVEEARGVKPDAVRDFRRVLDRKDVDVVLVCTPDHWHALPTIMAFQAGKDVYVEKPLGVTIAEGRAMVEGARRHQRIAQMGTMWRSSDHFREAVEMVHSGKLGKIRQVRAWAYLDWVGGIGNPPDGPPPATVDYDLWLGPAPKRPFNPNRFHFNFRWFWDYANGLMSDWGVHLLNIVLWAMGPSWPRTITSTGGKYVVDDNSETPDTQVAVYEFPNYTLIWEHQMLGGVGIGGRPHGICFSGSEATLIVDRQSWELVPEPKKKSLTAEQKKTGRDVSREAHVKDFLECVRSRRQPVEHLEIGHHASTVAHLGNVALRTGSKIVWNAETEKATGSPAAEKFIHRPYRAPWKLPYLKSPS